MKHLLIIDDERGSREALKAVFQSQCLVEAVSTAQAGLDYLAANRVDLVLSDVMMPGMDGVALLQKIQNYYPGLPVIMVSGATSVQTAVEAMRQGAFDYISKPFDLDELRLLANRAMDTSQLERRVETLEREVSLAYPIESMIGESASFAKAMKHAEHASAVDSTVLLQGESGTGKELMARLIHALSDRRDEPFVAVHCAALPENLLESELFGYEKAPSPRPRSKSPDDLIWPDPARFSLTRWVRCP